jgi:hypothetical protein
MTLSDREKIDRAAYHEEVRFYKRQQWAVTTAGVVLMGALLAVLRQQHITLLDKLLALGLIIGGVAVAVYFLGELQDALVRVRLELDPNDTSRSTRGRDILGLFKLILSGTATVVAWAIIFKLH